MKTRDTLLHSISFILLFAFIRIIVPFTESYTQAILSTAIIGSISFLLLSVAKSLSFLKMPFLTCMLTYAVSLVLIYIQRTAITTLVFWLSGSILGVLLCILTLICLGVRFILRFLRNTTPMPRQVDIYEHTSHVGCASPEGSGTVYACPPPALSPRMDSYASPVDSSSTAVSPTLPVRSVQFTALAPKEILKGEYGEIDIYMYEEAFQYVVERAISQQEESFTAVESGLFEVQQGALIRMVLTSPNLNIEHNEQTMLWHRGFLNFQFLVEVPADYSRSQIVFRAEVYINGCIATHLNILVRCGKQTPFPLEIHRYDIRSAFISYSRQDLLKVLKVIQGLKTARPDLHIWFDKDKLTHGENWEESIYHEIDHRDILYLCWSRSASFSQWVDKEWRYALEHKGLDGIEPIPLETPDQCPPPPELATKHFDDKWLYYEKALPVFSHEKTP